MVYSRHPLPINFPKLDAAYETVSSLFLPIAKLENDHISSLYFYCLTVPIELVLGCSCCIRSACAAVSGRMRLASACLSIMKMEHGYSLRPSKTPTGGREGGREGGKEERPDERRRRDRTQRIHPSAVGGKAATARQQMVGLLRVGHGIRMICGLRL